ncbi:TBC2 [Scenedesmus sp. PABB004]|nr:TBC2 [Scenedesmus sp. PABB004]
MARLVDCADSLGVVLARLEPADIASLSLASRDAGAAAGTARRGIARARLGLRARLRAARGVLAHREHFLRAEASAATAPRAAAARSVLELVQRSPDGTRDLAAAVHAALSSVTHQRVVPPASLRVVQDDLARLASYVCLLAWRTRMRNRTRAEGRQQLQQQEPGAAQQAAPVEPRLPRAPAPTQEVAHAAVQTELGASLRDVHELVAGLAERLALAANVHARPCTATVNLLAHHLERQLAAWNLPGGEAGAGEGAPAEAAGNGGSGGEAAMALRGRDAAGCPAARRGGGGARRASPRPGGAPQGARALLRDGCAGGSGWRGAVGAAAALAGRDGAAGGERGAAQPPAVAAASAPSPGPGLARGAPPGAALEPGAAAAAGVAQQAAAPPRLRRPEGVSAQAMRQLLQQQVQGATSWQQLQQLLHGRRELLSLKHLSLMVVKAAHLHVAEQRRAQHLMQQRRAHAAGAGRPPPPPPADLLPSALAGGPASAAAFLDDLGAALHEVLLRDQGAPMQQLAARVEAALAAAAAAAEEGEEGEDGDDAGAEEGDAGAWRGGADPPARHAAVGGGGRYCHAPAPLSAYLADALWGFAKLGHVPGEARLLTWAEAFAGVAGAADGVSFSQALWALGALALWPGGAVMAALAAELGARMRGAGAQAQPLPPRALSNALWACAVLGYAPPPGVLDAVWAGSAAALGGAPPQALSNLIWSAASLGLAPPAAWMEAWAAAALEGLRSGAWNAADIAGAAWAMGKLNGDPATRALLPPLPWRLVLMRAGRAAAGSADPRELTGLAWGLTACGVAFSKSFAERLLAEAAAKRVHFKAREWAQLLAALARQGVTPPPAWQRCVHAAMAPRLRFMAGLDFATCAWALGQLGVQPRTAWRERFFAESYGRLFLLPPGSASGLVWGLGRLRWRPPREWQERLFLESYAKLPAFTPGELAGTLHGLARLQLQPPVQWMWQATAVMALAAPDMAPRELTTCLWALSRLRYRPPEAWLAALASRAAELLPPAWRAAAPPAQAARQLAAQQRSDAAAAEVRRRRRGLLKRVAALEQQQALLRQRLGPLPPPQRQQLARAQRRQAEQLLQLRGDLELLEERGRALAARPGAADGPERERQQLLEQRASPEAPGELPLAAAGAGGDGGGGDGRSLGAGDVRVVLACLAQLQYAPEGDHPLLAAAARLGVAVPAPGEPRPRGRPAKPEQLDGDGGDDDGGDDGDTFYPAAPGSARGAEALARRPRHGRRFGGGGLRASGATDCRAAAAMERSARQPRAAALTTSASLLAAAREGWGSARVRAGALWEQHLRPSALLGWMVLAGCALLAAAAASTAVCVISGALLGLAWVGVAVYTTLVALTTAGAAVSGVAALFFSGTCAVSGTLILGAAGAIYAAGALYGRAAGALAALQQGAKQAPARPAPRPRPLAAAAPDAGSGAAAGASSRRRRRRSSSTVARGPPRAAPGAPRTGAPRMAPNPFFEATSPEPGGGAPALLAAQLAGRVGVA